MLCSAWHYLTQSCLNSNMISLSNDTLSASFTQVKFPPAPTDAVPDAPAIFPSRKAPRALRFAAQWSWHDGRPPPPHLSRVSSAWEDSWWSNGHSFHNQAGPTSPGLPVYYRTAEEGMQKPQRGWSHAERAALSSLLYSPLGSIVLWWRIHLLNLHQKAMPYSNFFWTLYQVTTVRGNYII